MATNMSKGPAPNLQEIHDYFLELAKRAGEMITGAKPLVNGVGSKKNSESRRRVSCQSAMVSRKEKLFNRTVVAIS